LYIYRDELNPYSKGVSIVRIIKFDKVASKLEQQVELREQSKSTLENYIRCIVLINLYLGRLPHRLEKMRLMSIWLGWRAISNHHPEAILNIWFTALCSKFPTKKTVVNYIIKASF
jgi:hypothetical protein